VKYNAFVKQYNNGIDQLSFNAQTTIASSYGLLQVMYQKAIEVNWNDANGPLQPALNPALLMDTPDNLIQGDGSLNVGSVEVLKGYVTASTGGAAGCSVAAFDPSAFSKFDDFEAAWISGLKQYNCDWQNGAYGTTVVNKAKSYKPTRTDTGIQNP
jgi:hypothetical protein